MTQSHDILSRLDGITAAAEERMRQSSTCIVAAMGGATIDFMTPEERSERHELLMSLPTFAEEREMARQRLLARRRGRARPALQPAN